MKLQLNAIVDKLLPLDIVEQEWEERKQQEAKSEKQIYNSNITFSGLNTFQPVPT